MNKEQKIGILNKIERLIDLSECKNKDYVRGTVPPNLREEIYNFQQGKCFLCEIKTTVPMTHHIIPNGESTKENLVMLCQTCHNFIHGVIHKFLGYRNVMRGGGFRRF